jgi:hypothetical protein
LRQILACRFAREPAECGERIVRIGGDPWLVREFEDVVRLHRPDAARLQVTALDQNGLPRNLIGMADNIVLEPRTVYYRLSGEN